MSCYQTASYLIPATNPGYKGYYQYAEPPRRCVLPCDLQYVYTRPKHQVECWQKCRTKECHEKCVVEKGRHEQQPPPRIPDAIQPHRPDYYHHHHQKS